MWSFQALIIFAILLPGFITRAIMGSLTRRKMQGDLATVIESFIFSFIIYLVASSIYPMTIDGLASTIESQNLQDITKLIKDSRPFLLLSFCLSIGIGLLATYLVNHDILHGILRTIKATRNTSRSSTWLDTFHSMQERHVIIILEDGRRLFGYPLFYSDDQDEGSLFLENPEWIDDEGNYISCEVAGILITKNENIKRIEFLLYQEEKKE
jgi:hypothetical protein